MFNYEAKQLLLDLPIYLYVKQTNKLDGRE